MSVGLSATHRRITTSIVALALTLLVGLGSVAPAFALAAWPTLRSGSSGPNVTTLQYLLRHRGYTLGVDGAFGAETDSRVRSFQSAQGLAVDGIVGPNTWSRLVVTVDYGMNGNHVRALQTQLVKHGYGIAVDGAYGPATQSAVQSFKSRHALGSGTTVTSSVWQQLTGASSSGGGSYSLPLGRGVLPRSEYDDPHHDYPAIDLPVGTGTAVYAIRGGTATRINDSSCGYGYSVAASDGATYSYCHFSSFVAGSGSSVSAGQLLGYSGNTGNSTGPHLHVGIRVSGVSRCPQRLLLAIYDGTSVPSPSSLPTTGCFY